MKVSMYDWMGGNRTPTNWWKHNEVADVSWEQIKELFDTGLNVMLCHTKEGGVVLFIDDKRFTQR